MALNQIDEEHFSAIAASSNKPSKMNQGRLTLYKQSHYLNY